MVTFTTPEGLPSKGISLELQPLCAQKLTVDHAVLHWLQFSAHLNFESLLVAARQRTPKNLDCHQNVFLLKNNTTLEQSIPPTGE